MHEYLSKHSPQQSIYSGSCFLDLRINCSGSKKCLRTVKNRSRSLVSFCSQRRGAGNCFRAQCRGMDYSTAAVSPTHTPSTRGCYQTRRVLERGLVGRERCHICVRQPRIRFQRNQFLFLAFPTIKFLLLILKQKILQISYLSF